MRATYSVERIVQAHKADNLVVTSVGAGYVGAMTAITMAVKNPKVQFIVCDINQELVDKWNRLECPFFEPQLEEYLRIAVNKTKNIEFTTKVSHAIAQAHLIIISVNTPPCSSKEESAD